MRPTDDELLALPPGQRLYRFDPAQDYPHEHWGWSAYPSGQAVTVLRFKERDGLTAQLDAERSALEKR